MEYRQRRVVVVEVSRVREREERSSVRNLTIA
jgi:hypothetical protein